MAERRLADAPGDEPTVVPDASELHPALAAELACSGWWRERAVELRRCAAAERVLTASRPPTATPGAVAPGAVGALEQRGEADRLVQMVAPLGSLDADRCARRLEWWTTRQGALVELRGDVASEAAVTARIAARGADWTVVVVDVLRLSSRSAASEALLSARVDGVSARELAARSARPLERSAQRTEELPRPLAALLASAVPDEALGPLEVDGDLLVVWLVDRQPPMPEDPALRRAATGELVDEALERASAGYASELGPL